MIPSKMQIYVENNIAMEINSNVNATHSPCKNYKIVCNIIEMDNSSVFKIIIKKITNQIPICNQIVMNRL